MKKICPACGAPVLDPSKQFCSKCESLPRVLSGGLSREEFEQISQAVSTQLKDDWKFKAQIVGAVILLVLAIIGIIDAILGFNLKDNMAEHFRNLESQATNKINASLGDLDKNVQTTLARVDNEMRSNIIQRFGATHIQAVIQDVAKEEAKLILESEVQPAVTSFKEDALFMRTIARAQGYDFKAYEALLEIGKGTNENAKIANQALDELDRSLARDRSEFTPRRTFMSYSGTNFYRGPFTSDELASSFSAATQDSTSFNREGFINTLAGLNQPLFLPRLVECFTNETDLAVADRLTIAISGLAKEDFHPRDFERVITWWSNSKASFTSWPFADFDTALNALLRSDFSLAVKSFEQVLSIDPSADMSRAFAIKSWFEVGQTNKAVELAKGFKDSAGRWAKWGNAFVELETGSVSNATVSFAELSKANQSTMLISPQEGARFWRKLDWPLLRKLSSPEKP